MVQERSKLRLLGGNVGKARSLDILIVEDHYSSAG